MNLLFLTLLDFESLDDSNLYTDLLREFARRGHQVYVITPLERRQQKSTYLVHGENSVVLRLRTPNTQKTGILEKGISLVSIPFLYRMAIRRYFGKIRFDCVVYSTPPITLTSVVKSVKRRDKATAYLLLKDIFPQNAVDIGLIRKTGAKGILYRYFKRQEKKLYALPDAIGCMSRANVEYLTTHNPEVDKGKIEVCPNSVDAADKSVGGEEKRRIREAYGIPQDKFVFVYGGNLGKPQGIPFLIECLASERENPAVFFVIVGDGTEYAKIESYVSAGAPNALLLPRVPKADYDRLVAACDAGMIFLDHRFTIPNFPSRLLGYMQAKLPVLAVTDPNTDLGRVIAEGGFGLWCESDSVRAFSQAVAEMLRADAKAMGENGFAYLKANYDVKQSYSIIMKRIAQSAEKTHENRRE